MSVTVRIPVISAQRQRMRVILVGTTYYLYFYWNAAASVWVMDIHDSGDQSIVNGIALVAGVDLLDAFRYLPIGAAGGFFVLSNEPMYQPTFAGFGVDSQLFYTTRK